MLLATQHFRAPLKLSTAAGRDSGGVGGVAGILNGAVVSESPRQAFSAAAAASNLSAPLISQRSVLALRAAHLYPS
jgi:hypothetical protein